MATSIDIKPENKPSVSVSTATKKAVETVVKAEAALKNKFDALSGLLSKEFETKAAASAALTLLKESKENKDGKYDLSSTAKSQILTLAFPAHPEAAKAAKEAGLHVHKRIEAARHGKTVEELTNKPKKAAKAAETPASAGSTGSADKAPAFEADSKGRPTVEAVENAAKHAASLAKLAELSKEDFLQIVTAAW